MNPVNYIHLFESKTNNAHLITFDNGVDYVVKLYKAKEDKALINEWFAYCIARFMGLPVPYSYLVEMPEMFIETIPNIKDLQYTSMQFASKYINDSVNAHEANIQNIINHCDLAKIIVFDYWLCNTDRTRKNVLLQEKTPGSYYLWVIDHAEILSSFCWTTNDLEHLPQKIIKSATHEMMAKYITDEKELKQQVKIIQSIPTQLLEEILSFVPNDWNISDEEKCELIKTLNFRRYKILPLLIGKFIKRVYRPIHSPSPNDRKT
ncbi:HipA family kinase [Bacillus methanolicus]|uniref:HipA-like kinase domain-containing protein n=1 Tax=Bacillus methanolicus (strain MGA3 / ATCC 53907) TaxID=796606 RepID=I3E308_BACMM|nr:HipA family kinase [Bacillus methanolicus]AIE59029.1 hypothetical protein BMMGA3_02825 [Bacillus methanolicus MGA3]EIJ80879.1 hypothetical protein MGA3_11280 [Bacillus methanolicus MGA3]